MSDALTQVLQGRGNGYRPARIERVAVVSTSPLTVRLPDGAVVAAVEVAGLTYTAGGAAVIFRAEPGAPLALPVTGTAPVFVPNNVDFGSSGSPGGGNTPPTAAFTVAIAADRMTVTANSGASTDGDGTITGRAWNWGDGTTTVGLSSTHTYAATGTKTITLTVTDNTGATDTASKSVTVTGGSGANQPPVAAFTFTQGIGSDSYRLNVDASASADPDGTINQYRWAFGNGVVFDTTNPVANGFYYTDPGSYTITLTVTDNTGATDTASKSVTVTAPTTVVGLGDAGGTGTQPSGTGIVSWSTLTGSTFSNRVNAAGSGSLVSLPAGTYQFSDFSIYGGGTAPTAFYFGAKLTEKGILGPGSKYATIQMVPGSSTKAYDVPTQGTYQSNQLNYIFINTAGAKIDGVKIVGTEQGHLYSGLRFDKVDSPTLSNTTIAHIPGNAGSPPGETSGVDFQACTGTVTVTNVTCDGGGVEAVAISSNNSAATYNITNLYTFNHPYSAGWASWEHRGVMNFHQFVVRNAARAFNAERLVGTVNFYDPLWDEPSGSHSDVNPTYEASWTGGRLRFYFSNATAWADFIAPRTTKKIKAITNQTAVDNGLRRSTVIEVYVGGVLQPQSSYVQWSGAGAGT